jgi:hypothetical protein
MMTAYSLTAILLFVICHFMLDEEERKSIHYNIVLMIVCFLWLPVYICVFIKEIFEQWKM